MELTDCINYLLTNAQNAVHLHFKGRLMAYEVTPAQYMVLYLLSSQKSLTPSRLAQLCKLDASTMTGILTRMERKGLLERQHGTGDRRSVDIRITADGEALIPGIMEVIQTSNAEVLSCLEPQEQRQLKEYLERIATHTAAQQESPRQ